MASSANKYLREITATASVLERLVQEMQRNREEILSRSDYLMAECLKFQETLKNFYGMHVGTQATQSSTGLKIISSSIYLPKQDNGEDAHFICADEKTIGVADGVGSWANKGIDAGQYARDLMKNSGIAVDNQPDKLINPNQVLLEAYLKTKVPGSSTACIITISGNILHAANVGDSGFMILRKGKSVYRSPVQQRSYNSPYQLGISRDDPGVAEEIRFAVEEGDIIVVGTDGLFDNMFPKEIEDQVLRSMSLRSKSVELLNELASRIANLALYNSFKEFADTPFSRAAKAAGKPHLGGKVDDITVIVAYVTKDDKVH